MKDNKEIENVEEVKEIKHKYKVMKKVILSIMLLIILIFAVVFIHNFIILEKVLKTNSISELGDNYKITFYINGEETPRYLYYKEGAQKSIMNNDFETIVVENTMYSINPKDKKYQKVDLSKFGISNNRSLISNVGWISQENVSKKDIFRYMTSSNIKIEKEEYKGTDYIILKHNMEKIWINPETYYIEKESYSGQVIEKTIEKNIVTDEDVKLPNLEEYNEYVTEQK